MYMRLDQEADLMRFHTQFAPENEVSKKRVVDTILAGLPAIQGEAMKRNLKGLVFESTSKSLIAFMAKLGFKALENTNDYVLKFEER